MNYQQHLVHQQLTLKTIHRVVSLDSGLGFFDSSHSDRRSPELEIPFQPIRKRKRISDSTDNISDDSAVEGDDNVDSTAKILSIKQSKS